MSIKKKNNQQQSVIYQGKSGAIEFRGDFDRETIWGNLNQIAELFGRDKSVISRHIKNIFNSGELSKKATVAKIATVQKEGKRSISREIEYFNLDVIISVGYRVDSRQATQFRIWATRILKRYLIEGYVINKQRIGENYESFLQAVAGVKALLPAGNKAKTEDILELVNAFAGVWLSLDAYDTESFPKSGASKKKVAFTADELSRALLELKKNLIFKK